MQSALEQKKAVPLTAAAHHATMAPVNMTFETLAIPGVTLITPVLHVDTRGSFAETWRKSLFAQAGIATEFVQDNRSWSTKGVLRGLHYQTPAAPQAKLVSVAQGSIIDVVVDLRRGSPAYGQWLAVELTALAAQALFVPVGCAHGFQVTSAEALVTYKVSSEYDPAADRGIRWDDPQLAIDWPLPRPLLSDRDANLLLLADIDSGFTFTPGQHY
jgi:dTDP-4-dehydrorhamnose 3,5-epimerase